MKKFYIDIQYATSVTIRTEHKIRQQENESSEDFLIRKLTDGSAPMVSISSEDHPEFSKLREQLGDEGHIKITRNCWNADIVTKSFYLNDILFRKRNRFLCAAAIKYDLTHGKTSL